MKALTIILLSVISGALTACQSTDNGNAKTAWVGTYLGTLPCADCAGIETRITLFADGEFKKTETQVDNPAMKFTEHGTITWAEGSNVLTLTNSANETSRYQLKSQRLMLLDADGNAARGKLAEQYALTKQPAPSA